MALIGRFAVTCRVGLGPSPDSATKSAKSGDLLASWPRLCHEMALPSRVFVLGVGLTTFVFFLARSSQGLHHSAEQPTSCRKWSFMRYEASPFEEKFLANADAWGQRPCLALTNMQEEVDEWITLAERSMKTPLPRSTSRRVLSSFYFRSCEGEEKRVPIEPVGGILRHPRGCEDRKYLGNKNSWMVVDWHAHAIPPARNLMFDVGASLWRSGGGGASQNWMWEEYAKRNATFDAFFAWEAKKHDPVVVRRCCNHFTSLFRYSGLDSNTCRSASSIPLV